MRTIIAEHSDLNTKQMLWEYFINFMIIRIMLLEKTQKSQQLVYICKINKSVKFKVTLANFDCSLTEMVIEMVLVRREMF